MIAISVELLHGTARAASASDLALTDQGDPGEWPLSPARVFSALVAGDGTRERCRMTGGSELVLLEAAGPPTIYASPRSEVLASSVNPRYVVVPANAKGSVQEYPGRKSAPVRPGTRLSPRSPRITYVWEDVQGDPDVVAALAARAARVGYIGCADSPARIRVHDELPLIEPAQRWIPASDGATELPVPFPGLTGVLDAMYDAFAEGQPARRSWYPTRLVRYRGPDDPPPGPVSPWTAVLWFRLHPGIPGRLLLHVTGSLKAAVMRLYESNVGAVPPAIHGHGFDGNTGYQLVHWLGLADVGHEHARGRLHGLGIAVPATAETDVVRGLREATTHLRMLTIAGRPPLEVRPYGGEARPWTAHPRRWIGPSRRWVSAAPVVHERRAKRGITADDVARWCVNAGIRTHLRRFRMAPVPLIPGALSLRPSEVFRQRESRRPYGHLEVTFEDEIEGPLVLGRARQFGIGLMAPVPERR